jgi:hypothetical protein
MTRLFCSKPFNYLEVTATGEPRGNATVCCWVPTKLGNFQTESFEAVWNGEKAQAIRRSILDGSFDYCDKAACAFLQSASGPVQRIEDVTDANMRAVIDDNLTVLPWGPGEVNAGFDRSCNLSCPSCRTEHIIETDHESEILNLQERLSAGLLKHIRKLFITGSGDPFGSPYFFRWLRSMKRADMPNLEAIHLHTNAMLWTPNAWRQIPEEVRALIRTCGISIDAATAGTYAVNRRGGVFEKLLENLQYISGLRKGAVLDVVHISMVVQANNFREMPDFVRLGRRFGFDMVYFGCLRNWGTFTGEEYRARAVHLPGHPDHAELRELLSDPIFMEPPAFLGNMTELLPAGLAARHRIPLVRYSGHEERG